MITYSTSRALEPDSLERGADRDRAELGRRLLLQAAAELAERRADGGDDDGAAHAGHSSDARDAEHELRMARRRLSKKEIPGSSRRANATSSRTTASTSARSTISTGVCM